MSSYEYKVVPFSGQVTGNESADAVSQQLQKIINEQAGNGWEFCSLDDVRIQVQPGCLGRVLGREVTYISHEQVIFRREAAS